VRASAAVLRWLTTGVLVLWLVSGTAGAGGVAAAEPALPGQATAAATAAIGQGTTINLFYGAASTPEAWSAHDRGALAAALPTLALGTAYNQWLAIADLRGAYSAAGGRLEPGGIVVYPQGPSAVIHVLDLALWARENALLWLLGLQPPQPYPGFGDLGYRDPSNYIGSVRQGNPVAPEDIGALMDQLALPPALFAGDRVFLMPYRLPQEYGVTDVYGPGIRIWLGADANIDLRHVLYHELGHAVHFRFGGFDTIAPGRSLSAFWQQYLAIRGLAWHDPTAVPWGDRTIECFADDFAFAFRVPGEILGYQPKCAPPTPAQTTALEAFWSALPGAPSTSPFEQAQWVQWLAPWPAVAFGGFSAALFTSAAEVPVQLALAANAVGGPYTVQVAGEATPLTTLQPGSAWSGSVPVPAGGKTEVDADAPAVELTWLDIYNNAAFVPTARISGVFPDTLHHWARAGIAAAVRAGVVGGYPDGSFRPGAGVTRAEFARMLATALPARLFGQHGAGGGPGFTDLTPGFWAEPYIAAVGGALPGAPSGGPFLPNLPLSRQEAIAWLAAVFGFTPLPVDQATSMLATYPDGSLVLPAEAPWFAVALALGLAQGDAGSGALRPDDPLGRAEAAVLVMRAERLSAVAAGAD